MAAIYKEVFLQNKLALQNTGATDTYIYLKMPLQTLQTLPHAFDNQVIEEIYIDVDNTIGSANLFLILPPISNPNIPSLPQISLPDYTSADVGFKGSWNIKIYINYQPTSEALTGSVTILPFTYDETYADTINGNPQEELTAYAPNTTIYLKPIENNTWLGLISAQPIIP
jgi:hypothetical protein